MANLPALAADLPRVVSSGADKAALTIYPDNLALITETRTVDLPKGKSTLVFEGVSDRMVPASALLREFTGFTLERNFDYARLGKANLFASSIGKTVVITRTDKHSGAVKRERAQIVSAGKGVVFKIGSRYEVFQCSGLSEGTQFENLPEGLNNVPELSLDVDVKSAGPQQVVISYLADNFSWKSDYRLDLAASGETAKLAGWLTINNQTSQSFIDVPLAIIAGQLNRSYETRAPHQNTKHLYANCWPNQSTATPIATGNFRPSGEMLHRVMQPTPMLAMARGYANDEVVVTSSKMKREVKQEDLGDYKLYRVNEPVTVAAYQTKQIRFIGAGGAKVEKLYILDVDLNAYLDESRHSLSETSIEYRLDNDKGGPVSKPLPKGNMLVFAKGSEGQRIVVGETSVRDTAVGSPMKIYLDKSFLVQVATVQARKIFDKRKDDSLKIQLDISHTITNASDRLARVEVNIPYTYKSLKITGASHKRDESVGSNGWMISVPAGESAVLKYRAAYIQN